MKIFRTSVFSAILGLGVLVSTGLSAATVEGTIFVPSGSSIGSGDILVSLYKEGDKGFSIDEETLIGVDGSYGFSEVETGNYKIHARMAPGFSGHFGDTWYDEEDPNANGLFGSEADILAIESGESWTDLDINLPLTGGFHGTVSTTSGGRLANVFVRAESMSDGRHHHNDVTKNYVPRVGEFSFRGLRQSHDFRLIAYDPSGAFATQVFEGPIGVANQTDPSIGDYPLSALGADPNEPNNSATSAVEFDVADLPFTSSDATIYPRGADVDWYCFEATAGERLMARAESTIDVDGQTRQHPWFDPMVALFDGDGDQVLATNDDDPDQAGYASLLDTGPLEAGRHCFVVSTYGDQDWSGVGQQTAGSYTFDVERGNRPPTIAVDFEGQVAPPAPATIAVSEGDEAMFEFSFADPDGDAVDVDVTHLDNGSDDVPGTLDVGADDGIYTWSVAPTAANGSPYEIVFTASDGEFAIDYKIFVEVESVNFPPTTPELEYPVGGIRVDTHEVDLELRNSTDPDEDPLTYEFELHEGEVVGDPDQTGQVSEDGSGITAWTTESITENAFVAWRARAFDGNSENGYSPWSEWEYFMVDTVNFDPETPQILKPTSNEVVLTRTPRVSASVPEDPEGDPLSILFEISGASDFETLDAESEPIAAGPSASNVEWTTEPKLGSDANYYVRAMAIDDRGGESDWSESVRFYVQRADEVDPPQMAGELGAQCEDGLAVDDRFDAFTVTNVDDSGDELSFEVQVERHGLVLFESRVPQSDGEETTIDLDASIFDESADYAVRVRTINDQTPGPWQECLVRVGAGDVGGGDDNGDGDASSSSAGEGCGCAAAGSGTQGVWWASLLLLMWFGRRQWRRRPARA